VFYVHESAFPRPLVNRLLLVFLRTRMTTMPTWMVILTEISGMRTLALPLTYLTPFAIQRRWHYQDVFDVVEDTIDVSCQRYTHLLFYLIGLNLYILIDVEATHP